MATDRGQSKGGLSGWDGKALEELGDVVGMLRPGEQVALRLVAAEGSQLRCLIRCFDALGDDLESECLPHCDHRRHQRGGCVELLEVVDECSVDLELVDREAVEVRQ